MMLPLLLSAAAFASAPAPLPEPVRPAPAVVVRDPGVPRPLGLVVHGPAHRTAGFAMGEFHLLPLFQTESEIQAEIARGAFAGAAVAIGRRNRIASEWGIGTTDWAGTAVDPDRTLYDLASLTKVVATTTAVMLLVEDGRMELDAPVERYLPTFVGAGKERVTIRHLLTHTSGLPSWADIWGPTPQTALGQAIATPLARPPGAAVEYTDVGPVILWAAAERAAGEPLRDLLQRRVFQPLRMRSTRFLPGAADENCAPTGQRPDGTPLRGLVHDPISRKLGGVAGNAGLFSTVHDLARFAAMLAGDGELDGVRVLRAGTVQRFTQRQPGAGTRALGWDTRAANGRGAAGESMSPRAFGHTGFTGTSLWVDPDRGTWTVLLTNRTYRPRADNRIQALRRSVHNHVAAAAEAQALYGPIAGALSAP